MTPINADMSDPDRTHAAIVTHARYGYAGMIERGAEHLMAHRGTNHMDGSLYVQAKGLLAEVAAVLDAAGEDPVRIMEGAMHNVRAAKTQAREREAKLRRQERARARRAAA